MPEDTWNIVKEFMLDWRETHKRKLKECLDIKFIKTYDELIKHVVKKGFWRYRSTQGIRCQYPKKCISWNYDRKTKCIISYWRIPWKHDYEIRVETPDQEELDEIIKNHDGYEWGTDSPYITRTREMARVENMFESEW